MASSPVALALSANMKTMVTPSSRSEGDACAGRWKSHMYWSASTITPMEAGSPSATSALKNFWTATTSRSGASRWYTARSGKTTVRSAKGMTSSAWNGLYAAWYQPTSQ